MESYHKNRISETIRVIENFSISIKKTKSKVDRIWALTQDANEPSQFSLLVDDLRNSMKHLLDEIQLMLDEKDALIAEGLEKFIEIVNLVLLSQVEIDHERFKSQRRGCYVTVFRREMESYKALSFKYLDKFSSDSNAEFARHTEALSSNINSRINVVVSAFQTCSKVEASIKCFKSFMKVSESHRNISHLFIRFGSQVKNVNLIGSRVRSAVHEALVLINKQLLKVGPEENEIRHQLDEHRNNIEEFLAQCD